MEFALADWKIRRYEGTERSSKAQAIWSVVEIKCVLCSRIQSQQQGRLSTLSRSHHFSALLWLWRSSRMVGKAASRSLAVGRCSGIATSLYRSMWSRNQREVFWLKEKCARNGIPKGEFMGGLVKLRNLNACFILRRAWDLNGSSRCAANL